MDGTDATRLVRGSPRYVADLPFPEAAWMSVVRSDIPHGHLTAIDTERARSSASVLAVLTASDFDEVPLIPIRIGSTPRLEARRQPVIASDRVRYFGEPLAVVVAETAEAAEDAARLVTTEITPLDAVAGPSADAGGFGDVMDDTIVEVEAQDGDLDAAFAAATTIVDVALATSRKTGLPIEPRGLVARWEDGELDVWGPTKFVNFTRRTLANMLDLAETSVRCHRVNVGGMFGVRGEFYPEDFLVPWAARLVGRTVRWTESRREHLVAIHHAGEQHNKIRIGLDKTGRPSVLQADVVIEVGAYSRPIGNRIPNIVVDTMPGPYDWDAFSVRCRTVATHRTPTGTVRGPAAYETAFARERALDIAARSAALDPLQVRTAGLIPATAIPYHRSAATGEPEIVFDNGDFGAVLEGLLESSGYTSWTRECEQRRADGEAVGIGLGLFVIHSGIGGEETVEADLESDGSFLVRTSASDVGQGLDRMAAARFAELMGVPEDHVNVWSGDTSAHDKGRGTFSSRSTLFVANALTDAADQIRRRAAERTAELLGGDAAGVTFTATGTATGDGALMWKELGPISVEGKFVMAHPTYGFGAHVSLVSVDRETGVVTPERMAIAYDCGRALDLANTVDQIAGAAVAGIGAALFEHLLFDENSAPQTLTLTDYLIPTSTSLPTIDVFVHETAPAKGNPLGLRGVGEAGIIGAGASLANAVAAALGEGADDLIRSLPIDRELIALSATEDAP